MRKLQEEIINTLAVTPSIDPAIEVKRRVEFLKDYLKKTGLKTLVLGISGGQDSSLAGRLSQLAVESLRAETADDAYRFIAVRLPYGEQADEADAMNLSSLIRPCESTSSQPLMQWLPRLNKMGCRSATLTKATSRLESE